MQANQQGQTTTEPVLKNVTTRLPEPLIKRLGKFCIDADITVQDAFLAAIEQYLDRQESPKTAPEQGQTAQTKPVKTVRPIEALEEAAHKAPFFKGKDK